MSRGLIGIACSADSVAKREGIPTSSRCEMELKKKIHTNVSCPSTPVPDLNIPIGQKNHLEFSLLSALAINSMKVGTTPGPDHISANLLRAGGFRLYVIQTAYMFPCLQKERIRDQWRTL